MKNKYPNQKMSMRFEQTPHQRGRKMATKPVKDGPHHMS